MYGWINMEEAEQNVKGNCETKLQPQSTPESMIEFGKIVKGETSETSCDTSCFKSEDATFHDAARNQAGLAPVVEQELSRLQMIRL